MSIAAAGTRANALAIIAVRNAEPYLDRLLLHLARNGVQVFVIDNESRDATERVIARHSDAGTVVGVREQPYRGFFDLQTQLQQKLEIARDCQHEWVIHLDADELPHSPLPGERLADALRRADRSGCNAIDFDEFVFLPLEGSIGGDPDSFPSLQYYYHYRPAPLRLMRAWRRDAGFDNLRSGGHRLDGEDLRLFDQTLVLRHYPFLSQQDAYEKYPTRTFNPAEVARGWHTNRVDLEPARFRFPSRSRLQRLDDPQSSVLDGSRPQLQHYWYWPAEAVT